VDWVARIEGWLRNFRGMEDQDLALSMVEDLRVFSQAEVITACGDLLAETRATLSPGARVFHLFVESSGGSLWRSLEKVHGVRGYEALRPRDFYLLGQHGEDVDVLSKRLKKLLTAEHFVIIWDTVLGSGDQMRDQRRTYAPIFEDAAVPFRGLKFAFVTGHPPEGDPDVFLWEPAPVWSEAHRALNERYASRCSGSRRRETGALVTPPDNPPNNAPVILRAPASEGWATLLDREETRRP